jgi:hypothetical protein
MAWTGSPFRSTSASRLVGGRPHHHGRVGFVHEEGISTLDGIDLEPNEVGHAPSRSARARTCGQHRHAATATDEHLDGQTVHQKGVEGGALTRPLDAGRCWWCHYRLCSRCRVRNTGSAFLAVCLGCEARTTS